MPRAKAKQATAADEYIVRRSITAAMKGEADAAKPLVVDPKRRQQVIVPSAAPTPSINVRDNLLRIVHDADPIGFLISVQKGDLQPVTHITPQGELETRYVQPDLAARIGVAQFLAHKVLPSLSITKKMDSDVDPDAKEAPVRPGQPGAPTFSQMVAEAAKRAGEVAKSAPNKPAVGWEPAVDGDVLTYGDKEPENGE